MKDRTYKTSQEPQKANGKTPSSSISSRLEAIAFRCSKREEHNAFPHLRCSNSWPAEALREANCTARHERCPSTKLVTSSNTGVLVSASSIEPQAPEIGDEKEATSSKGHRYERSKDATNGAPGIAISNKNLLGERMFGEVFWMLVFDPEQRGHRSLRNSASNLVVFCTSSNGLQPKSDGLLPSRNLAGNLRFTGINRYTVRPKGRVSKNDEGTFLLLPGHDPGSIQTQYRTCPLFREAGVPKHRRRLRQG